MKSIMEKTNEVFDDPFKQECFEAGANYVLDEIENFIKYLDLGNSAEEKFYKLDVLADIGLFIEQLKK